MQNDPTPLVMIGGSRDGETMAALYGRVARVPKRIPMPKGPIGEMDVKIAFEAEPEMYYIEEFHGGGAKGIRFMRHESLSVLDCMNRLLRCYTAEKHGTK